MSMFRKIKMRDFFCGMLAFSLLTVTANAASVTVEDAAVLYPVPGKDTSAYFSVPPGSEYVITDIEGKEGSRGQSRKSRTAGFSEVRFSLPSGWYQIHFPGSDAMVGVAVVPDGPRYNYWSIDAGLTWSRWSAEHKQQVVNALRRKGIGTFRERMSWSRAESEQFHGKTRAVREMLYHGDALELWSDSPTAFRLGDRKNSFFMDFSRTADGIRRMESGLGTAWSAVELWNEPFYNGALPADQYIPVAKLLSAILKTPVCGGSFTPAISHAYLSGCLESGFADILDAFSIHFYSSPEKMRDVISYYRTQLKTAGREAMPIWVTESGTPDPTLRGAVATAMRAIECRTLGVERFYAFYLQQYREGKIEWGMSDASGTPRPALACYLAAASFVGNKAYSGDMDVQGDVSLVRCFSDESGSIAALYGKPGAELTLPVEPDALAGADGRAIPVSGKVFCNADGLGYAFYAPGRLDKVLKQDTENRKLFHFTGNAGQRRKPSVVLQPLYPKGQVLEHSNNGYIIEPGAAENFIAAVICNNLTDAPVAGILAIELPDGRRLTQKVSISANGGTKTEFKVNFRAALERDGEYVLRFTFNSDKGEDRIVQRFERPATIRSERLVLTDSRSPDWAHAKVFRDTTVRSDLPGKHNVSAEEFHSEGQFLWSDIGIHFRVTVKDRRHEPTSDDGSCWMYDSLQLAVSQYNSVKDNNRFEWGFWLDANGRAHKTTFLTSTGKQLSDDSEIAIRRDEVVHTTCYEGVIAWSDLGSMNAIYNRDRMRLRLTFCVNDGNNGSRRWSEWTPGIATTKSPDKFVEFLLVSGEREVLPVSLKQGIYRGNAKDCILSGDALKLNDVRNGRLEFQILPVKFESPVTLRFELAATEWRKHNGTGFCFDAALEDSVSAEAYFLRTAPNGMFGGKTGYAIQEKGAPAPILGMEKKALQPSGLFHKVEFTIDPGARKFELAVTPPKGRRELVVSGPIHRNTMRSFDRIVFTTSGWGAGPFLLKNISLVH